jgi:hypothetical protein
LRLANQRILPPKKHPRAAPEKMIEFEAEKLLSELGCALLVAKTTDTKPIGGLGPSTL